MQRYTINYILNMKKLLVSFTIFVINVIATVPTATNDVLGQIFQNHKTYIVYAHRDEQGKHYEIFDKFCSQNQVACAQLNGTDKNFNKISSFLGFNKIQFFFILDSVKEQKYVLEAEVDVTIQSIKQFYESFQSKTLKPFYASEPIPETDDHYFRRIVGATLDDFLALPAAFKVVFLTTDNPVCEICPKMKQGLTIMSKNVTKTDLLIFGYIDITKNDHPLIKNEVFPHFLIFKKGSQQTIEVKGSDVDKLLEIIMQNIQKDLTPQEKQQLKKQKQQMDRQHAQKQDLDDQEDVKFKQQQEQDEKSEDKNQQQVSNEQGTDL